MNNNSLAASGQLTGTLLPSGGGAASGQLSPMQQAVFNQNKGISNTLPHHHPQAAPVSVSTTLINSNNLSTLPHLSKPVMNHDEVSKQLSSLDPETRDRTIQMGTLLKTIVQLAIEEHSLNPHITEVQLMQRLESRVGPFPIKHMEIPVEALKSLYSRIYNREASAEHIAALACLSRMFRPKAHLSQPPDAPGRHTQQKPEKRIEPPNKKLGMHTNKEHYEYMLSKMSPQERACHPPYEQMVAQFESLDNDERQKTKIAASKLREFIKASVELYLGHPAMSFESYRQRMIQRFGQIPEYPQWYSVSYNNLCTLYDTIYGAGHSTPHVSAAMKALHRLLPKHSKSTTPRDDEADKGTTAGAGHTTENVTIPTKKTSTAAVEAHMQTAVDKKTPEYGISPLPEELRIECDSKQGVFFVQRQTVHCLCQSCLDIAKKHNKAFLELSTHGFERHAGLGGPSKKWTWKYTIRVTDPMVRKPGMTLATWLKEQGISSAAGKFIDSTSDDGLAEIIPTQMEDKVDPQRLSNVSDGGINDSDGLIGRAQRQRKTPTWMKEAVDPGEALKNANRNRNRVQSEYDDDQDGVYGGNFYNNTTTNLYPQLGSRRGRLDSGVVPNIDVDTDLLEFHHAKRARLESEDVLESQIDNALARGLHPHVHGWRITDENQLAVTLRLGEVIFSGILPAQPPTPLIKKLNAQNISVIGRNESIAAPNGNLVKRETVQPLLPRPPPPKQQPLTDAAPLLRMLSTSLGAPVVDAITPTGVTNEHLAVAAATKPDDESSRLPTKKELRLDERRAIANSEYNRLLVEGPPEGAKCAMCHLPEIDSVPRHERDSTGKSHIGLGALVLVRTSAVTNGWVHDQCARWSPDVYDPTGEGLLEGVAAAVRRGRMLRCKTCGQKGATLGCMKKTCKSSYHLKCARDYGCLLNMDPYAVACPEHVAQLPGGLSHRLGFRKGQRLPVRPVQQQTTNHVSVHRATSRPLDSAFQSDGNDEENEFRGGDGERREEGEGVGAEQQIVVHEQSGLAALGAIAAAIDSDANNDEDNGHEGGVE